MSTDLGPSRVPWKGVYGIYWPVFCFFPEFSDNWIEDCRPMKNNVSQMIAIILQVLISPITVEKLKSSRLTPPNIPLVSPM